MDWNARRAAAGAKARAMHDALKKGTIALPKMHGDEKTQVLEDLLGQVGQGNHGHLNGNWRRHFIYLIYNTQGCTIYDLCEVIGITHTALQFHRRTDAQLDQAINDHHSAFYESEAQGPSPIKPGLIAFGLEAKSGWRRRLEVSLDASQVNDVISKIVSVVTRVVDDPKLIDAIITGIEEIEVQDGRDKIQPLKLVEATPVAGASDTPPSATKETSGA